MKVWVLMVDSEIWGVFKNAEKALEKAKTELYHHACVYDYPPDEYEEARNTLIKFFNERETYGFFGTCFLDWEISITESELN